MATTQNQYISTHPHIVECNADAVWELVAEVGDLGISLTEVGQENEAGIHRHANIDGLRHSAKQTRNS